MKTISDSTLLELHEEHRTLALLHEAGGAMNDAGTENEALEQTLEALCRATGWTLARGHLLNADGDLVIGATVRREPATLGPVGCAELRDGQEGADNGTTGVRRLGIPIMAGSECLGVIELFTTSGPDIGDQMRTAVTDVGVYLGRALEHLRLERYAEAAGTTIASFVARAAHELKNPVAAAGLALSTLAARGDRLDDGDRDKLLAAADRSVAQMHGLVDRLIDLAAIERHAAELRELPLAAVVGGIIGDLELVLGRSVVLDVPDGLAVMADEVALTEILGNLVTNAVRHGGPTVKVSAAARPAGAVTLSVEDDGPGVAADILPKLFEPFVRGGDRKRGFGLGLTISSDLARAAGGGLVHRPRVPHGAIFDLTLPRAGR